MAKKSRKSVLCFFFVIVLFNVVSVSAQMCDNSTGIFKHNSPYDKNRRLILSTFASNVTAHDGYFNGSIGIGPGRVSDSLLMFCSNQTDGFSWLGEEILCLVRYSSQSFSGLLVLQPVDWSYNYMDIKKQNQKEFDSVWDGLMVRTITRASSSVRNSSSSTSSSLSSSSKYHAKDIAPVPVYGDISVLMQCTPDVSSKDCKLCPESSLDFYKTWYHGKRGGIILRPSCFFRWELYTFSAAYDGTNIIPSPPPPKTTPVTNLTIISPPPSLPLSPPPLKTPSVPNLTNITKKNGKSFW